MNIIRLHSIVFLGAAFALGGCGKPTTSAEPAKLPPQEVGIVTIAPKTIEIFT